MNKKMKISIKNKHKNEINFVFNYNTKKLILEDKFEEMEDDFEENVNLSNESKNNFFAHFNHQLQYVKEMGTGLKFEEEYKGKNNVVRFYNVVGKQHLERNTIEGVIFDITKEKMLLQKSIQAEKLRSLGELAGGVAHDFNNQLMVIMGACELMKRHIEDPKLARYIKSIESSAKNSSDLIKKLLTFGQVEKNPMTDMNIVSCISDTVMILQHTSTKKVKVVYNYTHDKLIINGNFGLLQNAVLNVCKNAIESLDEDGLLTIKVSTQHLNKLPYKSVNGLNFSMGNYVKLEITDNGTGIKPEIIDKIFDPFFTTKGCHKGTGLGLSTVLGTIESHEGIICVDSIVDKGTTFNIYFKLVEGANQMELDLFTNKPKILVIDDEQLVRIILCDILTDLGYDTISFEKPEDAVDYYGSNSNYISLVLCDMMMPQMTGKDVFYKMRQINPMLKFIILSGYSADEFDNDLETSIIKYIKKPILMSELDEVISEALK